MVRRVRGCSGIYSPTSHASARPICAIPSRHLLASSCWPISLCFRGEPWFPLASFLERLSHDVIEGLAAHGYCSGFRPQPPPPRGRHISTFRFFAPERAQTFPLIPSLLFCSADGRKLVWVLNFGGFCYRFIYTRIIFSMHAFFARLFWFRLWRSQVFTTLALLNITQFTMGKFFYLAVQSLSESWVSIKRMESILLMSVSVVSTGCGVS